MCEQQKDVFRIKSNFLQHNTIPVKIGEVGGSTSTKVHSRSLAHGSSCGRVCLRSNTSYVYLAE